MGQDKEEWFPTERGMFRSDRRKKFIALSVVQHGLRFSREAVESPSLAMFQIRLDGALSSLSWLKQGGQTR